MPTRIRSRLARLTRQGGVSSQYPVYEGWLPESLGPNKEAYVEKVLYAISKKPFEVMCFVVALLEQSGAREAAKAVNGVLLRFVEEMEERWREDQPPMEEDDEEEDRPRGRARPLRRPIR